MTSAAPAARVDDPFGHSSAMNGVLIGLAVGALIGTAILTGGVSLIAVGAAVAITGGAGMAGQAIGQTIPGPDSGVITTGSPNVSIDRRPAAMTVLATGACSRDSGPPVPVATGAKTVRINNQLAARVGETMACSAVIRRGSTGVFIGGPGATAIKPTPEVPVWLENTMLAMTIGGTAIGTLGVGLTYGAGAAVGSLVGGAGGSYLGGQAASAGAAAMGYGATGQAIAGVAGGMLGGALGGGAGFRGGQMAGSRMVTAAKAPVGPPRAASAPESFPYSLKKVGQTEPGAVPNNPALQAEIDAGPLTRARSADGYPDLPADKAATFGDDVRPWNGDEHVGPIRRVIGSDRDANGGYWQAEIPRTEAEWRAGSAVLNDWNGNGGYVESPATGLRGWIGSARPQMSSDGINVLPGHGEQIWMPPGSASPGPTIPTPWSIK